MNLLSKLIPSLPLVCLSPSSLSLMSTLCSSLCLSFPQMFQWEGLFLCVGEVLRLLSGRLGWWWHHAAGQRQRGNNWSQIFLTVCSAILRLHNFIISEYLFFILFVCVFPQVYMWVGTQTSQVEIKLSLKACQVSLSVCVCASLLFVFYYLCMFLCS